MDNKSKKYFSKGETILWMVITAATVFVATSFQYTRMTLGTEEYVESNISGDRFKKLEKVLSIIEDGYLFEYDMEKLEEGAIRGLVATLEDPYTDYFDKKETEQFLMETDGEYEGIGVYITYDTEKEMTLVILPIEGSPAEEAGVLPGDYIIEVDGKDMKGISIEEVSNTIMGQRDSNVKLKFRRYTKDGSSFEDFEKIITRRKVDLNPFSYKLLENGVGYIAFTSFDEKAYKDFKNAINEMKIMGNLKGLIIDLRDNYGGLLSAAEDIADDILPTGVITYTVDKKGNKEYIYSDSNTLNLPVVVMVNENSASASEIMAAAIKDYSKGAVVGTKSYGKGLVQVFKSLKDGTYLKMTISEYFSPSGQKINELGVEPDYIVENDENSKEDKQLEKAKEVINEMIK